MLLCYHYIIFLQQERQYPFDEEERSFCKNKRNDWEKIEEKVMRLPLKVHFQRSKS